MSQCVVIDPNVLVSAAIAAWCERTNDPVHRRRRADRRRIEMVDDRLVEVLIQ